MTDITELAQSLKAAAEKATPGPWALARDRKTVVSNQSHPIANLSDAMHRMLADGTTGQDAEFISLANPANVLALVEALEKAQQRIDDLENDEVRQSLANAEHQLYMAELAKNNLRASRKAQFRKRKAAEQRIAELESRTVKLPKPISVLHRREFTAAHCAIYAYPEAEVNAALDGAGIKWEAE